MVGDIYIGKMFVGLIVTSLVTAMHLFAFFSFKSNIHTYEKKISGVNSKIHEQEKMKEAIQFQIYNNDNYFKVKDYIKKSDHFEKISLSDVMFYKVKLEGNMRKSISA